MRPRLIAMQPWAATAARLALGAVWIAAGAAKAADLAASVRAVRAYRLLPESVVPPLGAALPFVEVALGLLLIAGLGTRLLGAVSGLLLVVFVAGLASAWARGLRIECGCFGGGGDVARGAAPGYGGEIARDSALLVVAAFLVWAPRSRWSVDTLVAR